MKTQEDPKEDGYHWGRMGDDPGTVGFWSAEQGAWCFVGWPGSLTPAELARVDWKFDPTPIAETRKLNS
jgi:hypothetical protein